MGITKAEKRIRLTDTFINKLKPTPGRRPEYVDLDMLQLVVRVTPNGKKAYYLRYRKPDGTSARAKIADCSAMTPAQAREQGQRMLLDLAKGIDPVEAKRARVADAMTLGEFIDNEYAVVVLAHRKSGAATLDRLKRCFDEFWGRRLNDPTLGPAIQNWRAKRLKEGAQPSTVNRDITALKAALSWAVDQDLLREHPLRRVKPMKVDNSPKPRYLDDGEEKGLREALDTRQERLRNERDGHIKWHRERGSEEPESLQGLAFADHLKPMVLLTLNTGLRRGELFNLDWTDVNLNLDPPVLTVMGPGAKSGQTRHIPLNAEAVEVLTGWKAQTGNTGRVFKNKNGERFDNVNTSWESVLETAKITGFTWHDMRHDFASKLVMAGQDLNTVRELLGHSDIKMTLRYAHLSPQVKARAVESLVTRRALNVVPFPTGVEVNGSQARQT